MGCKYIQKEIDYTTKEEKTRCLHKKCDLYLNIVDSDTCDTCPFIAELNKKAGCKECDKQVSYEEPPVDIQKVFPNAKFEIIDDADADAFLSKPLDELELDDIPDKLPPMALQLWNYQAALRRWISGGRPTRSSEEVAEILETHCKKCDWYDSEKGRCKGCGCRVTSSSVAVLNKIKMATEHCPKELW